MKQDPNACRYSGRPGHQESWFIRAVDPAGPRALWLKMTLFAPLHGPAVAQTWFIWFDATQSVPLAHKDTVPIAEAVFADGAIRVARCELNLKPGAAGATGELSTGRGPVSYQLRLSPTSAAPLSLFPFEWMYRAPFPKQKLLTPFPVLDLFGEVRLPNATVSLSGWHGSLGHNWGTEHTPEYAWGQCIFEATQDQPQVMVEGYTGRVRVGGRLLPAMSALVVRRGEEELRFDRTVDFFRQQASMGERRWTVRLQGAAGEARLRLDATRSPMVCLGYQNPNGEMSYCFNSKLADALLEVRPRRGPEFRCVSAHGGALELLGPRPDPTMEVV